MTHVLGIDHCQLAAPPGCEAEARRFFGELLGLSEVKKPDVLAGRGGVWFAAGAQQLHVGVDQQFAPAVKAHPALRVRPADLESLAVRLLAAGAEVLWEEDLGGSQRFHTRDPWGNRLEMIAYRSG
jgi:catechol 2,3-dioxygenase-like lactoylglutathione lyase family enzyme